MRHRAMGLSAGALAVVVLAVGVVSASAGRLSVSPQPFRAFWNQATFREAGTTTTCRLTLEGSFVNPTIYKSPNTIGHITRAATAGCSGSSVTMLATTPLPWEMDYRSFEGTLPDIASLVVGLWMTVRIGGLFGCLIIAAPVSAPLVMRLGRAAGGRLVSATFDPAFRMTPGAGNPFCSEAWTISGTGELFVLGSATQRITLTLI